MLNAKDDRREAAIIAKAGRLGAVTISTAMAGRGTDIKLGANEEEHQAVVKIGGLYVIGTELHESERIDNQLRGRSGRQGDPGESRYFLSFDDRIYKKFGEKTIPELKDSYSHHPEGSPIIDWYSRRVLDELRNKVEIENKAIRKDVFQYDSAVDEQRRKIYEWRSELIRLDKNKWFGVLDAILTKVSSHLVSDHFQSDHSQEESDNFLGKLQELFSISFSNIKADFNSPDAEEHLQELIKKALQNKLQILRRKTGEESAVDYEVSVFLTTIDEFWTSHINILEDIEEGIGLRGYAQRDPLIEFRREASVLFGKMIVDIQISAIIRIIINRERKLSGDLEQLQEVIEARKTRTRRQ